MKTPTPAVSPERPKQVIGFSDRIDFPDLGWTDVEAKIDTGAYTSALHCTDVKLVPNGDSFRLRFTLMGPRGRKKKQFVTDLFQYKTVKNSFGQSEKRFVIQTRVLIMGRLIRAEFSLANRGTMRFPVLLGRKLLRNKFVVDVSLQNVSYQMKQQSPTS
ncbi:ATP-dependent zinc protease family protein [Larkinella terrae]|uniref:ATP-dependent zinc protease n=1 Tax=Larkinella terrae TaxID=2025311 RepID=A0A7K0EF01_9BACT|nr:RimK/LysX family protein [Larkinella terrae]MRS60151.1 ATP-dependent zinc protease [Larkinella terrae]